MMRKCVRVHRLDLQGVKRAAVIRRGEAVEDCARRARR